MSLNEILDDIISKEVYKAEKVEAKLYYALFKLPKDTIAKIESDKEFREKYKEKIGDEFQKQGYDDLVVLEINPSSNTIKVRYTGYYSGTKQYPEIHLKTLLVHLKTLLVFYEERGDDIRAPAVFDEIVEMARLDLDEKDKKDLKEERLYHFATLFKEAIY
jgi:hypothetical protein